MIDTDTRGLKRNTEGQYTTNKSKMICDHCGFASLGCELGNTKSCDQFMPALSFQDETGLGSESNTVRIGMAWSKRLHIGQRIALYNVKRRIVFGHAAVLSFVTGPIRDVLANHAHNNHLMLEGSDYEAPGKLFNWLERNYGPRIVNETTQLTAIYLLRQRVEDAAPVGERQEADWFA